MIWATIYLYTIFSLPSDIDLIDKGIDYLQTQNQTIQPDTVNKSEPSPENASAPKEQ